MLSNEDQNLSFSDLKNKIESQALAALNVRVYIDFSKQPLEEDQLTTEDRSKLINYSIERKTSFLIGRKALYNSLNRSQNPPNNQSFEFPNPLFSLSHTQNTAVAISHSDLQVKGIGIDIEFKKELNPKAKKFFLKNESMAINPLEAWTIKEACFKAQPKNKSLVLNDIIVTEYQDGFGLSKCPKKDSKIQFIHLTQKSCLISVALTM